MAYFYQYVRKTTFQDIYTVFTGEAVQRGYLSLKHGIYHLFASVNKQSLKLINQRQKASTVGKHVINNLRGNRRLHRCSIQVPTLKHTTGLIPIARASLITYSSEKAFALPDSSRLFLTVGLLGAFTTMSTFSLESFKLLEEQQNWLFITNLALNNLLCLAGIYLGKIASALL